MHSPCDDPLYGIGPPALPAPWQRALFSLAASSLQESSSSTEPLPLLHTPFEFLPVVISIGESRTAMPFSYLLHVPELPASFVPVTTHKGLTPVRVCPRSVFSLVVGRPGDSLPPPLNYLDVCFCQKGKWKEMF